jgi:hypothetical protein
MIAGDQFVNIFGLAAPGELEAVPRIAAAAAEAGFAVVPVAPAGKAPLCTLTPRQAKVADIAGRHACGLHHAITDRATALKVFSRMAKAMPGLNLGVVPGLSRMVIIDYDTPEQAQAFSTDWARLTGCPQGEYPPVTVRSPGMRDASGEMVHRDGGHTWLRVPAGVDLPLEPGIWKAPGGYTVIWGTGQQVLVPPSARPEGPYRIVAPPGECPGWLVSKIRFEGQAHDARARTRAERVAGIDLDDPIERWQAGTRWDDLLPADGWVATGEGDRCGCPIWTAPGPHGSAKSATAHEVGCSQFDTDTGWGPLHIWTDDPPEPLRGIKTVTPLQYEAHMRHGGDMGAAMRSLGLASTVNVPTWDIDLLEASSDPSAGDVSTGSDDDTQIEHSDAEKWFRSRLLSSADLDGITLPVPLVADYLYADTLARVIGKPGSGKSFVCLDMALSVATGRDWHGKHTKQGAVWYVAAEGVSGLRPRIRAWEQHHLGGERVPIEAFAVRDGAVQAGDKAQWGGMILASVRDRPALIIVDTQARSTVGIDENSATDMGMVVAHCEALRHHSGACVLLVHHTGVDGSHGRGSSVVFGALHTELAVTKDEHTVRVHTRKQKDAPEGPEIAFSLQTEHLSLPTIVDGQPTTVDVSTAILIGDAGDAWDVDAPASTMLATPAVRLTSLVHQHAPHFGITKAEARRLTLAQDIGPRGKAMGDSAFVTAWDECLRQGDLAQVFDDEGRRTGRFKAQIM